MDVILVTRAGCHLCDDALAALREVGVEPEIRDVDADVDLLMAYDFRVPVVIIDGSVVAEGNVSKERLSSVLSKR